VEAAAKIHDDPDILPNRLTPATDLVVRPAA
jgi:hypothetical protein